MGWEESCAKFYAKFINDPERQRCVLEKPVFLLYHGTITDIGKLVLIMEHVGQLWQAAGFRHNVVVCATGFSESVLAQLALNFAERTTINVFPLLAPTSPIQNSQLHFLEDLAAITGARVLDPLNNPLERATIDDLGFGGCGFKFDEHGEPVMREDGSYVRDGSPGPEGEEVQLFEAYATRSTIIGRHSNDAVLVRADQLRVQSEDAASELHQVLLQERLGRLTGGIAKLNVIGASNGELKEKRDRAEDAVCAVRAAIKQGCLPGGGWMLLKLMSVLKGENDEIVNEVLIPALFEPVRRLLTNCGMTDEEVRDTLEPVIASLDGEKPVVYDAYERKHVDPIAGGVLDSTPAVLEAVRNSLSIASQLGTLGGTVVFKRDSALETLEARENNQFLRDAATVNEADLRP
jgi:chaperonin GroEL